MVCLPNVLRLFFVSVFGLLTSQAVGQGIAQFRFTAFAIKGEPPTVEEAQSFLASEKSLPTFIDEWLESPAHRARVKRLFRDMFGVTSDIFIINNNLVLQQTDQGVYYSPAKGSCDLAGSESVSPWWLESGTVRVCSNSLSNAITYNTSSDEINCLGDGIFNDLCGCGPDLIICIPKNEHRELRIEIRDEFANRGLYAYENDLSWMDLLGGNFFFGTRLLYWFYLQRQYLGPTGEDLPATAKAQLLSLPSTTKARLEFPATDATRAGLVTSPGFLIQNNNFRSRIRALTNGLLCRDVDSSLNLDGYEQFLNSDFTDFDRSHGDKEGCDACHYAMDNLGSTLFGWNDQGFFQTNWWVFPVRPYSTVGYAFGQEGEGPAFLAQSYIERGPGFAACMAKTVWETLTGGSWDGASEAAQQALTQDASLGPRGLIRQLFVKNAFGTYREGGVATAQPGEVDLTFAQDIKPIIALSCSGSTCHSAGTQLGKRYDFSAEEGFRKASKTRIGDGSMPPSSSGKSISSADRQTLIDFLK